MSTLSENSRNGTRMAGWHRINVADLTRRDLLEYRKWLIDDVKMDPDARSERRYGQWRALTARQPCPARFSSLFLVSALSLARADSTSSLGAKLETWIVPLAGWRFAAQISAVCRARSLSLCSMRSSVKPTEARCSANAFDCSPPSSLKLRWGSSVFYAAYCTSRVPWSRV